jgi:dihydroorotate dehydrogenase electron transfer subunit
VISIGKRRNLMFKIITNEEVGPDIFKLALKYDQLPQKPEPGQFFNIKVSQELSDDPLLRRPFSIFDFKSEEKRVEFIYKVVGKGTKILSKLKNGTELDVLGPLGSPFSLNNMNKEINLIGGGMGIAPLFYLAKKLEKQNADLKVYLGAADKSELNFFENKFSQLKADIYLASMSEELTIKGTALDLWLKKLENKPDFIYSCGPEKMLAAVEKEALKNNIIGEISIEKRMGCGIGVCLSCSCETKTEDKKNKRACVEGPVFELGEVVLDG